MEFTSQICTTKEQSELLLKVGLKKETADMYYTESPRLLFIRDKGVPLEEEDFPAWSLHRLIEIMPNEIVVDDEYPLIFCISHNIVYYADNEYAEVFKAFDGDLYQQIINCIEWLIKEGYFNEEYLEK